MSMRQRAALGRKNAKAQKRRQDLEQQVLTHLHTSGAALYLPLSVRFDPNHTSEFQPLLRGLKEYGYIDVSPDKMVTITTFGLQQLDS